MSIEVLSGVTVYRSTRKLHPPSTNSDATFDNFNPPPFRVPGGVQAKSLDQNGWSCSVTTLSFPGTCRYSSSNQTARWSVFN